MGKGEKTGLGRALVKKHRHMIQESNEKGQFYRRQSKKVLESITDVSDIDAVIGDADEKDRVFASQHSDVKVLLELDPISEASKMTPEELREQQMEEEALHASSLRVPRRPPWNSNMTVEELDANERQAFLSWRRSLAKLEENERLVLTPFEKNLDIWRQLWRVVERSDLLVTVVDARNPLFYRCSDLEAYVTEMDEHKRTMLLINKADLLPVSVRESWANYFRLHGILFLFWSAKAASAALEGKNLITPEESVDADTKIYGREELLARLQSEAEKIVLRRTRPASSMSDKSDSHSDSENFAGTNASVKSVMVGFVGYPNVGKSSTINALVGEKRTGVTSTPGKTKHFQTLIMSDRLTLCDCPGLVFPSFTSSRYEMIASGVLPIARMTEHRDAVQVVADRVPRGVIENVYNISLPKPKSYESQSRPPTPAELLRAYCASRGYVSSRGLPDETRASRQILKDYIDGKLPHFQMPPGISDDKAECEDAAQPISSEMHESDSSDDEYPSDNELISTDNLEHVLDDMDSFDTANGLVPAKDLKKKKPPKAPHKQHKKPQRKKDRTWRVQNAEGDGMPLVRVHQKPVNTGPSNP